MALGCTTRKPGSGSAVIFVHEYAGDWRTWEPQMRYFSRAHRCVTYSQRGYPPSDVPEDGAKYSQDIARDDVFALMDALKIDKAHVVGHSMGAYTALHVGIRAPERCLSVVAAGCGYGSSPDAHKVEEMRAASRAIGEMFAAEGIAATAARYADGPARQTQKNKDPRGFAEFAKMLGEHSAIGHALTMLHLQAKRPTLWDMEADLKKICRCRCWSSSATRTTGALTAACSSSARCRPPACWSFRAPAIPSPARSRRRSTPRLPTVRRAEAGRWLAHKPK